MNLQTFISETISQISKGIEAANEQLESTSAIVSPRSIKPLQDKNTKGYGYLDESDEPRFMRVVEEIEFDVAVTATEGKETKGGIGIMVGAVGIGSQGKSESENASVSRIRFRIPVVLPNPETKEKKNESV